ncbi:MAG: mechanosensitive ion channel family protein [Alphaproteobacteria bacterium]|nr:mechanosensitive ion channel family protein [Alphaproteobacteria bacterium]MBO6629850.1 mechanosensitive ion channel family protein [Alphaproteobacteria bacterium]MDF1625768.1 mechanosensitive ion channel family protein [Parvibaculaceae bacterium]
MEGLIEQGRELWQVTQNVWQTGALGYDIGHFLTALGIFLAFYFLRGVLTRFVFAFIGRWVSSTKTTLDDYLFEAIADPLRATFIVIGVFFGLEFLDLEGTAAVFADNLTRTLIAITIFWALRNAVKPLSILLRELENILTHEMVDWLVTGIRWAVILVGGATVLQIWGIQVAPIIAGLGLFGVAVALGAQDLFKNLIAGLSILIEKRYRKGDWVLVDGIVEGTVETIGFRSTTVRRFDKAPVYVPNQILSDGAVTNFSEMTHRRIYWKIGVEYRTTREQLETVRNGIESYLLESDKFGKPPEVPLFVRIDAFNDSSIDIMVYCFTKTTNWGEWLEIKEQLALALKTIVEEAGTGFAFPSQSVYVEVLPDMNAPGQG